jgi:hypothetical protein
MKRREFIRLLGGVAATQPIAAHAQQPALGYLESGTPADFPDLPALDFAPLSVERK